LHRITRRQRNDGCRPHLTRLRRAMHHLVDEI
jgi:hypothetical protein